MQYKEFELILSSFNCNKNCPYCTAKITKWPVVEDNLNLLNTRLDYLKSKDINFRYFILCGNGEPSLAGLDKLKQIRSAIDKFNIFEEKRFQSSGNIFNQGFNAEFELFKNDFIFEITRVSLDAQKDMKTLGYNHNYLEDKNFKRANIRLNYVLMKNKSMEEALEEIKEYINLYPNIKTVSLKTLNLNTKDNNIDNPYSKWIIENAYTKSDADYVIKSMRNKADVLRQDDEFFDRVEWKYHNIPITFYIKKLSYGISNIVFYGGKLVNYSLQEVNI